MHVDTQPAGRLFGTIYKARAHGACQNRPTPLFLKDGEKMQLDPGARFAALSSSTDGTFWQCYQASPAGSVLQGPMLWSPVDAEGWKEGSANVVRGTSYALLVMALVPFLYYWGEPIGLFLAGFLLAALAGIAYTWFWKKSFPNHAVRMPLETLANMDLLRARDNVPTLA